MPLPTTQGTGLHTPANPPRQRPPQYSFIANASAIPTATDSSITNNSNRPAVASSTNSSIPKPISSSANTSTKPKSKSASVSTYSKLKQRSRQWINDWITDWWGLELISWVISASALLAIFVLLESHRGRPLPEWPFSITVNSLVSVFATIAQMAMMKPIIECISQLKWLWFIRRSRRLADFQNFDDASRGPTGSLVLLGKLRGRHLVSLGAVITVVSIAFGPVSQQVVTYPLRLHAVGNASTPRAYSFAAANGENVTAFTIALSEGLSGTQNLSDLNPFCNTGNCTWSTYSSLGVCNTNTANISSMLINNTCNPGSIMDDNFNAIGLLNPGYPCYNYTLPVLASNLITLEGGGEQSGIVLGSLDFANATLTSVGNSTIGGTAGMPVLSLTTGYYSDYSLLDINILYQKGMGTGFNLTLPPPIALRSTLHLCIQTFNTTVTDSNTTTELISSQPLNITLIEDSTEATPFFVNGSTFDVGAEAINSLCSSMVNTLTDGCTLSIFPANETSQDGFYCYGGAGTAFYQGLVEAIDPIAAANTVMENIAISLTNSFRSGASGSVLIDDVQGIASLPASYVETKYVWFTLPIGLVLLTFIFLLATITKSKRLGAKNWKSSNFTTLQGLHANAHNHLGGLESLSVMEEKVDEVVVRLDVNADARRNGNEWRLVMTN